MVLQGRVWKFGDNIGATQLVSSKYDKEGMSRQWAECAKHVLEDIDPDFSAAVQQGDLLIAGENLGMGHHHYYMAAIKGCETAGLRALFGESINMLFQREAIDVGMPCWSFKGLAELVETGDELQLDLAAGTGKNVTSGRMKQFKPVSPVVLDILDAGSSKNWALRRVGRNTEQRA